jgi:spermidine/putrescine transport system substrate-binding protein
MALNERPDSARVADFAGKSTSKRRTMTRHPREARGFDRREFLRRSATATVGLSSAGALLAACASDEPTGAPGTGAGTGGGDTTTAPFELARKDNPVTLPLYDDNPAIASGLEPEAGPLKVYNWIDYLDKKTVKKFDKEFGVKTEITIFNTMDEAIAKLQAGSDFDVFFPTPDRLGKLVAAKLLQPINLDYLPNLQNMWPQLQDPFYDVGSRYTVPYVIYTTGIGYRTDHVTPAPEGFDNPYDIFYETKYGGRTFLLDDYREAMCMLLLRNGVTNMNTSDEAALEQVRQDLLALTDEVNVKLSVLDYTLVPEGRAWLHQAWSGDFVSAQYYLPKGVDYSVLGYWFPPDGKGLIGSDTMAVLRSAKNPVLAHEFLNFMMDNDNAYANFYNFVGYQPPLNSLNPDRLVADEVVPPHLDTCVVRPEDFDEGYTYLELSPEVDTQWQNIWAEFKAGV